MQDLTNNKGGGCLSFHDAMRAVKSGSRVARSSWVDCWLEQVQPDSEKTPGIGCFAPGVEIFVTVGFFGDGGKKITQADFAVKISQSTQDFEFSTLLVPSKAFSELSENQLSVLSTMMDFQETSNDWVVLGSEAHYPAPESDLSGDQQIEQEIQDKGLTAPRVTPAEIEANIVSEHYFTAMDGVVGAGNVVENDWDDEALELLTFCVLILQNGFTVTGESACASPENFDAELGRKIARQNAVNKMWPLMGYELKSKLAEVPADFRERVRAEEAELQGRIDKLAAFLPTDTFNNLPKEEQDRLTAQLAAMQDYCNCLSERIAAFGGAA